MAEKSNAESAAQETGDKRRGEIAQKLAGLLTSQQAKDAGFESADVLGENEPGTVGVVIDGDEFFVSIESA